MVKYILKKSHKDENENTDVYKLIPIYSTNYSWDLLMVIVIEGASGDAIL